MGFVYLLFLYYADLDYNTSSNLHQHRNDGTFAKWTNEPHHVPMGNITSVFNIIINFNNYVVDTVNNIIEKHNSGGNRLSLNIGVASPG